MLVNKEKEHSYNLLEGFMNVFINDVSLENMASFKAELIFDIINELDLNDDERFLVLDEIISQLDETLML